MFKRRRGVIVKCAALIAVVWFGCAIYVVTVARSVDDGGGVGPIDRWSVRESRAEARQHPLTPTIDWLPGRHDDRANRDRELQLQFRRDQEKLRELLADKRTPAAVVATPPADLRQYDPQTASLIRLGLIIPKWNLSEEVPEHLGAPGKVTDMRSMLAEKNQLIIANNFYDALLIFSADLLFTLRKQCLSCVL